MKSFIAFTKKEWLEQIRKGRLLILLIIFILFGIMNPAIAKITPRMMELLSDTLSDSGMIVSKIEVNALTSWTQFYKNIPTALIVFVLMLSGTLTSEYQKGTLITVLTKGLERWKVICSKALTMLYIWTAGFALTYGITYGYNAFFWDNSIANHLFLSAGFYYLFGVWVISLIMFFSALSSSVTGVLLGTGGCTFALYIIGMIPKIGKYFPVYLCDGMSLLTSQLKPDDFLFSIIISVVLIIINMTVAVMAFNKKKI